MFIFRNIFAFIKTHKIISTIAVIMLIALAIIFRPKPTPQIATQKIERKTLTQVVSVSGSVVAKNMAALTFPIGGTISWVGVKQGDTVTAGQVIATLDQRTALKNLQQSLTAYSIARNTYDQTISNNGNTQNPDASVNDTEKRILQNNQYNLNQAINSVELSDLARQQSVLVTPIAGIVTRADTTTAGTTALPTTTFTVIDPTSTVFSMDVDEADIGKIQQGQLATITLDAYPKNVLSLPIDRIDFVSHATSNGGNAYAVTAKLFATSNNLYRVGMNGNAEIITSQKRDVLVVPLASLVNTNQVYVKTGNTFTRKTITLGLQSDTEAEVTSGLTEGEVIALDPNQVTKK